MDYKASNYEDKWHDNPPKDIPKEEATNTQEF